MWQVLLLVLALPDVASAAAPKTFGELVTFFVNAFNMITAFLILVAFVSYLYAILLNMGKTGETSRTNLKNIMLWGILALFVMVSIWGILRILQATLFGTLPTSATMLYLG